MFTIGFYDWMLENEKTLFVIFVAILVFAFIAYIFFIIKLRRWLKENKGKKIKDTTW